MDSNLERKHLLQSRPLDYETSRVWHIHLQFASQQGEKHKRDEQIESIPVLSEDHVYCRLCITKWGPLRVGDSSGKAHFVCVPSHTLWLVMWWWKQKGTVHCWSLGSSLINGFQEILQAMGPRDLNSVSPHRPNSLQTENTSMTKVSQWVRTGGHHVQLSAIYFLVV